MLYRNNSLQSTLRNIRTPKPTLHKVSKIPASRTFINLAPSNHTNTMAFFPRLSGGEFTPLFRLLDDYDAHRSCTSDNSIARSFAPKFDVRECKDAYHLDGEIPGVNQKDIDIEFTDSQTLVVRGHAKREYSTTNVNAEETAPATIADAPASSHQATVEDEEEPATASPPGSRPSSPAKDNKVTKASNNRAVKKSTSPGFKYWMTERSYGEFNRVFKFPSRVDQDAVSASLKDGILRVKVPKASAPTVKKVNIA